MRPRDYRDIWGGAALIFIGCFAAIKAFSSLRLGTVMQMGPGMFPVALSCILVLLGVLILVPALFRAGDMPDIDFRALAASLGSIFAFAILVRPFGMIAAIVAMTLVAGQADGRLSPIGLLILAACLSTVAALIFKVALGLPLPLFAWPSF